MRGLFLEWNEQSLKNTYINKSKIKDEYGSIKREHRIAVGGSSGGRKIIENKSAKVG